MLPRAFKTDAEIRQQQINTLKIFNDKVTEILEGEEYDVLFSSGGHNFCLKVSLGKEFPKEKPILKIVPVIIHHWINEDGEVKSAPGLLNFTLHSDLGRVVQAIIREFQRSPPPLASNNSTNIVSPTIPINGEIRSSPINYQSFPAVQSLSPPTPMTLSNNSQLPHPSLAFPELLNLSLEELNFLNENSDRQDEFIDDLPIMKKQNKALDDLILQVEDLAELNLSKEEKLQELRKDVNSRIEEVNKLAFDNERLHSVYKSLSDKYTPRHIKEQLGLAAEKADRETEKVAESFLNGETDVEKFLADFIKIKTLSQTRKTKEEKLSQQLDRLERAGF
ncbi:unnamed protein product [Phaedon cochleariae]|uniref:VPS37 C-terminal domain-containing protein n=1 Tax=Phaedon cochleariae TaxID=80249 RepID=A0A9N9SMI5_PHACE|nr:unnamed protein product [Phaedon cochleariae]